MMENGRGQGEKDEWQARYHLTEERWGERAETKAAAKRQHYKMYFITKPLH
jgi:hypothetical protein